MDAKLLKSHLSFGGMVEFYSHASVATGTDMQFSIFRPSLSKHQQVPIVYWLSGLTCTEENFTTKSGYQQFAEKYGMIVVAPDTSPRKTGIPGEEDDWTFGAGASFYVDATESPWNKHYRMFSYVSEELPALVEAALPVKAGHRSIMGHSMGGHGALVIGLTRPDRYRSISAFSPICAPTTSPWGQRAFVGYLGEDRSTWTRYDACHLMRQADERLPILVDQGLNDSFLTEQLRLPLLEEASADANYPVDVRRRPGYDHSYFYISSFIEEHFAFHAQYL